MKKFLPYFIVFVIGFIVCAWVVLTWYGPPSRFGGIASVNSPHPGLKLVANGANQVRDAAKVVSQYVVNIDTIGRPQESAPDFFGLPFGRPEGPSKGQASGVIFTPDGYILTNNHVVQDAQKLTVTMNDGARYTARLIGTDPKTDLAVIKVDVRGLKYATFGNSDTLQVGDWVIAVGSALGFRSTVTVGVVSAIRQPGDLEGRMPAESFIQTDAAINRGNSGGALADLNGDLVGINTMIASTPEGGNIGIGFAIPSKIARQIADQLVKNKSHKVVRPWLGIQYTPLNDELRARLKQRGITDLPKQDGAMIMEVYQDSPAAEAGLQPQDVILKINGKPISGTAKSEKGAISLSDAIGKAKVGDRIMMEVWHASNGRVGTIGVRVSEMPTDLRR